MLSPKPKNQNNPPHPPFPKPTVLSGYLLEKYCPEAGPRNSSMMWLIIGLVTATSPVLITLTERWVREPVARGGGKGHSDDGDSEAGMELEGMGGAEADGGVCELTPENHPQSDDDQARDFAPEAKPATMCAVKSNHRP